VPETDSAETWIPAVVIVGVGLPEITALMNVNDLSPTVPVLVTSEDKLTDPGGPGMAIVEALVAVLANRSAEAARAAKLRRRPNFILILQ
jgi:hypothetical protein